MRRIVSIAPVIAIALAVTLGLPGSGTVRAEDLNLQRKWGELFNARNWDGLARLYHEDAIAIPPNHEPIRGRGHIVEYFRSIRESVDKVSWGEPARIFVSGNLVSLVGGDGHSYDGQVRYTAHELYERQPDGSLVYVVDMFGFRDPLK